MLIVLCREFICVRIVYDKTIETKLTMRLEDYRMKTTMQLPGIPYAFAFVAALMIVAASSLACADEDVNRPPQEKPIVQHGTINERVAGERGNVSEKIKDATAEMAVRPSSQRQPGKAAVSEAVNRSGNERSTDMRDRMMTDRQAEGSDRVQAKDRMMMKDRTMMDSRRGSSAENVQRESPAVSRDRAYEAVVVSVDRPENCLRVRSGPSKNREVVGCLTSGQTLHLTGVFSKDGRWAQTDDNTWVYFRQVRSDLAPPKHAVASRSRAPREEPEEVWTWEEPATAGAGFREAPQMYDSYYETYTYPSGSGYVLPGAAYSYPARPRLLPPLPPPPALPRP
jgi:hypothetical protein